MSSRSRCFHVAGMPPDSDNTHPVPLVPFPAPPSSALLSITVQLPVGSKQKGQHPQARKGRDLHSSPRLLCYCLKCSKVTRKERGPLQGGGEIHKLFHWEPPNWHRWLFLSFCFRCGQVLPAHSQSQHLSPAAQCQQAVLLPPLELQAAERPVGSS